MLHIAYQPYEYSAQVLYAKEAGLFAKHGLNVDLQEIAYGSALAAAVASNAVDVGIATITTLSIAHSHKIPFLIIAPGAEFKSSRPPTGFLVVGKQTAIFSAKDMNGKTVGTPGLATIGEYGVRAWVDANGGDATTLKFVEMPFSQMPAAFASGQIDAAFVGEPFLAEARKTARPLAREMDVLGSQYVITAWFAMAPWIAAHPDLVARFNATMRETSVWAAENPSKSIEILAHAFKQDPATISKSGLATFAERITPAMIESQITMTAKYGKFTPFPAEELIYSERG